MLAPIPKLDRGARGFAPCHLDRITFRGAGNVAGTASLDMSDRSEYAAKPALAMHRYRAVVHRHNQVATFDRFFTVRTDHFVSSVSNFRQRGSPFDGEP
jgi:hypothetical protein